MDFVFIYLENLYSAYLLMAIHGLPTSMVPFHFQELLLVVREWLQDS